MKTTYDWLVVGGGFQGIIAAALLAKKGERNIAVLERGAGLGGVLRGKEHNGLMLDFGCHLFNNDESEVTALMLELLGDKYHPVDVEYASITQGNKKEGIAVPSFGFLPSNQIEESLKDILNNAKAREAGKTPDCKTLQDWINEHYGENLGASIIPMVKTACGHAAQDIDAEGIYKTQLSCIHLSDDEKKILPLKESHPEFGKVVALSSQKNQMRFYPEAEKDFKHRTFYPSENGTRGFAQAAEKYFEENNVNLLTEKAIEGIETAGDRGLVVTLAGGEKIRTKKLIWTLDVGALAALLLKENKLTPYGLKVPLSLFYYFVDKDDVPEYTYLHDFTPEKKFYRVSAPGFYGRQVNDKNQSYICVEVPADPESDLWQNPQNYSDDIWQEIKEAGMVKGDKPQDDFQISTPVSYPLMKPEYKAVYQEICDRIADDYPDIINVNMNAYTKNDIVRVISKILTTQNIAA